MSCSQYNDVEKEFLPLGVIRGGIIMLKANDALEFLKRCKEKKYTLLGIDGFYLTDFSTQPSLEDSIDLSTSPYKGKSYHYEIAARFIEERACKNLHFEIVVDT